MHLTHPLRITTGQVVVNRDHMDTTTGEGVEVAGQGGHKGFAFPGFHLGNLTLVQHHAANQLNVEVTHAQNTLAGFAHHCKGLRQDFIQDWALIGQTPGVGQALLECGRLSP